MRSLHCLFWAAVAAAVLPAIAETPGLDAGRLKLIRPRLQELVDRQEIPGAVALVARHGQVQSCLAPRMLSRAASPTPLIPRRPYLILSPTMVNTLALSLMSGGRILNAALPALRDVSDETVRIVHLVREDGRHEGKEVVRLEIGGLIRDEGVGRAVGLVEAVLAELEDDVVYPWRPPRA